MSNMEQDPSSDERIREILSLNKVVVIGMSKNSSKAAHYVPKYLSDNGYDITPVNPTTDEILGKKCYSSISEIDGEIDIVDVFRPSDQVLPVIQEAIKKKPKVIWLQEGIHNSEAEDLAKKAGIQVVFNRCMLAEHQRLSQ
ncbi:CoA-binding protein [Nitrosopumilus cobalaminigenes]|uniref:CoA-binding protein n=2 Tax=Nitrosopumilus cobalaminigenes TaxID=1470066 RepID=A0A7D5R6D4_9ARCH|nr:CoA-binding protein [Nitrosopumilus cobalaminigenes]